MDIIRKPHNLVTSYWDDSEHFSKAASKLLPQKIADNDYLPPEEKRVIRYAILSSFLFLEAFINAEYFDEMGFSDPRIISTTQKNMLDHMLVDTDFEEKWSNWVEGFCGKERLNLRGQKAFQDIKKLKDWRNNLTHYKIHNLLITADIETIENAREANRIAKDAIKWFYELTKKEVAEWIRRDLF